MLDDFDRKILRSLQSDSQKTLAQTANDVGLSVSACHRRIGLLERAGVIEGYGARINAAAIGRSMTFYVEVSLSSQSENVLAEFEAAALARSEVLECHLMTGQADYLIRVAATDTQDYEQQYRRVIAALPHVARIQSALVMKTVKPWRGFVG